MSKGNTDTLTDTVEKAINLHTGKTEGSSKFLHILVRSPFNLHIRRSERNIDALLSTWRGIIRLSIRKNAVTDGVHTDMLQNWLLTYTASRSRISDVIAVLPLL